MIVVNKWTHLIKTLFSEVVNNVAVKTKLLIETSLGSQSSYWSVIRLPNFSKSDWWDPCSVLVTPNHKLVENVCGSYSLTKFNNQPDCSSHWSCGPLFDGILLPFHLHISSEIEWFPFSIWQFPFVDKILNSITCSSFSSHLYLWTTWTCQIFHTIRRWCSTLHFSPSSYTTLLQQSGKLSGI